MNIHILSVIVGFTLAVLSLSVAGYTAEIFAFEENYLPVLITTTQQQPKAEFEESITINDHIETYVHS